MERKSAPHIGQMLRGYVKQKRISQSGWARKQGVGPKTIARYLKQPAMRIDTLFNISQMLNYNFLQDIAAELPAELPPGRTADQSATVAAL
jgi:transcriptional regulator with XRE-family HTH domain